MPLCDLKNVYCDPLLLKAAANNTCRFHCAPREFTPSDIGSKGLCPEVYYLAYPYLFALVYGAKLETGGGGVFEFACPNFNAGVRFEVVKTKISLFDRIKNIVKKVISPLFHVVQMQCGIDLKLVGVGDSLPPQCPHSSRSTGEIYHINFGQFNDLCPAAFRSVFPYYVLNHLRRRAGRPVMTDLVACPDHKKNLIFAVSDNENAKNGADTEEICCATDGIDIQTIKGGALYIEEGSRFSIKTVLEKLGFPCPMLLNVGIPYYLTLSHGGKLGFYTYDPKSAMIQCPNTHKRVTVEVVLEDSRVIFKIHDVAENQECPRNIKPGDRYGIPVDDKHRSVMEMLNLLIFYSVLAKQTAGPLDLTNINHQSQFRIEGPE